MSDLIPIAWGDALRLMRRPSEQRPGETGSENETAHPAHPFVAHHVADQRASHRPLRPGCEPASGEALREVV